MIAQLCGFFFKLFTTFDLNSYIFDFNFRFQKKNMYPRNKILKLYISKFITD